LNTGFLSAQSSPINFSGRLKIVLSSVLNFFESDLWNLAVTITTTVPPHDNLTLLELTSELCSSSVTIYPRLLLQYWQETDCQMQPSPAIHACSIPP